MAEEPRSTFDFSDQFGSDPITRRYSRTGSADIRLAEAGALEAAATRQLAESNLAKVQAELTAQLAPMKMGVEMATTMSELVKRRTALQEESAIRTSAATISEGLGNPNLDLPGLSQLVSGPNTIGLRDPETGVRVRSLMLDKFKQAVDNAESPYEVDTVFSSIPSTLAAEPEFVTARTNALSQANLRQGVRQSFASEPSLGGVPVTTAGGVDVPGAQISIAAEAGAQERRKEARENLRFVQPQIDRLRGKDLDGSLTNEERLQLKDLEARVPGLLSQMFDGTAQRLGGGEDTSDLDAYIGGGGGAATPPTTTATTEPPTAAAPAPAPAPSAPAPVVPETPKPLTLEEEAMQAAEQGVQAAARASIAPQLEQKRAAQAQRIEAAKRRLNLGNLREERSRLLKSIYDNEKGQKLKRGLAPDSDIVKRVQARIAEIDTELPKK
jgi:hypothetical protein